MTQTQDQTDRSVHDERESTAAEIEAWQRDSTFLPADEATPDAYPSSLYNISAGMIFGGVIRPVEPELPDYVAIDMDQPNLQMAGQVGMRNMLWEASQFRRRFFDEDEMPAPIDRRARPRLWGSWLRAPIEHRTQRMGAASICS